MYNIVLAEIGIIIIVATLFAYIARALKQPLIPAYILGGLLIGPVFGLVQKVDLITTLSEIGIAFLLFIVGLEIEFKRLRHVAQVSTLGGMIKMAILFLVGFIAAKMLGMQSIVAVYLGLIIAFSSTMVVIKLLSDRSELDTLHGRIVLGMLLMEDFIAILALAMLSNSAFSIDAVIFSILKMIFLIITVIFMNIYILPPFFKFAARTKELLFLASISVLFLFSIISMMLDISLIIGAFLAGLALANLPYHFEIIQKVMSLKDFFSIIFFVSIGMSISFAALNNILLPFIIFLGLVLILKPILTMVIVTVFGYKKRPAFLSSLSLAQISEFALIIALEGLVMGHINQEIYTLTILLALVTMGLTSYFISFDNWIYRRLSKRLDIFEKILPHKHFVTEFIPEKPKYDVILCGYNRVGYSILKAVKKMKKKIIVIDFNPEVIRCFMDNKVPCLYGDVGDVDILDRVNLKDAELVISTVPEKQDNIILINKIKQSKSNALIFVTATNVDDALELYEAGSDYVILPHFLGGEHAAFLVQNLTTDLSQILKKKNSHIKELKHRKNIGHDIPTRFPRKE